MDEELVSLLLETEELEIISDDELMDDEYMGNELLDDKIDDELLVLDELMGFTPVSSNTTLSR